MELLIIPLISWLLLSFVVGFMGGKREIGENKAFFTSLFFSPLIGFIVVLSSTKKSTIEFQKKLLEAQGQRQVPSFKPMSDLEILEDKYKAGLITKEEYRNILKRMGQ